MRLLLLPNELLLQIADKLDIIDLYTLCQVSRYLYEPLYHCLYCKNVTDNGSDIIQWTAIHNRIDLLRNVLPYNPEVNTTAPIYLSHLPLDYSLRCCSHVTSQFRCCISRRYFCGIEGFLGLGITTPLILALAVGYTEFVSLFLQHSAIPNMVGTLKLTPLMAAASEGHNDVIELLFNYGAAATIGWEGDYNTAWDIAVRSGQATAVRIFLKHVVRRTIATQRTKL